MSQRLAPTVRALAHRGFHPDGDENTLAAFKRALDLGATAIETDTRATSDFVALAFHDSTTERAGSSNVCIAQTTHKDLGSVTVGGEPIPTLQEALTAFPNAVFNIDIKDYDTLGPAIAAITAANAGQRVCLASFHDSIVRQASRVISRETGRDVARSAGRREIAEFLVRCHLPNQTGALADLCKGITAFQVPEKQGPLPVVTPRFVDVAHDLGIEVHVWTVDERADMERLLEQGVDGLVTNRMDILGEVLR